MSATVFLAVLGAAVLHAVWNALVKGGHDKMLATSAVVIGQGACGAAVLVAVPAPDWACWPWLIAGLGLHLGYQVFLMNAYRIGDLTQVYPIARGTAPLLVAGISVGFLGVSLGPVAATGVLVIGAGIISLGLVRQRDGLRNRPAALLAVATGCFIAAYSLVDGTGARVAGTPLGFYGWLAALNAIVFAAGALIWRPALVTRLPRVAGVAALGGGASFVAYALVVWAFTEAPIALVTALRETSIVFALLIGAVFLKEKLDLARLASTTATLLGAVLLKLGKG